MHYLKYFFGGKVMGCFGNGSDNGCEWIWWLILLAILFFCFCNGDSGIFSDLFEDCEWLVWLAIVLLLIFLCSNNDVCSD